MKLEPSSPSEVYLALAVVSTVLMMEMAAFALLGAEVGAKAIRPPTQMASTLDDRAGSAIGTSY
jgi:hypothetical protein